jgi:hypothetical protein
MRIGLSSRQLMEMALFVCGTLEVQIAWKIALFCKSMSPGLWGGITTLKSPL